jgi:hypothetical protein
MKFNIKYILGIATMFFFQGVSAQFYVGLQTGVGNIQSKKNEFASSNELGGALKVGYVYSLNNHIGIGAGVEFSQYKQDVFFRETSASLSSLEVDQTGSAFVYTVTAASYRERQTLRAVQIPLFLQYKTNINKGIDFNFKAGAKYFLPLSYKIKASAASVNGTAYYPDVNLTIDDLPEYGFGEQNNYAASGEYQTKGIVMSMFELGFTFDMGVKNALSVAMFFEKGYGSILDPEKDESYIGYNPTSIADRKANGLYGTDKSAKIRPVAFGLALAWIFK